MSTGASVLSRGRTQGRDLNLVKDSLFLMTVPLVLVGRRVDLSPSVCPGLQEGQGTRIATEAYHVSSEASYHLGSARLPSRYLLLISPFLDLVGRDP